MTTTTETTQAAEVSKVRAFLSRRRNILLLVALGLVLLAAARTISGASYLTAAGTVSAAIAAAVPIAMAGLGGLWSERSGIVNIGLEGGMILGSFGAGLIGWQYGGWAGVAAGVTFGLIGGLLHAIASVTFGVDQIISGVAINILALGATQYLASAFLAGVPGGGSTQSPPISSVGDVSVPGVDALLAPVEARGWFLVSDLAGIVRGALTSVSWLTVLAVVLVVATYIILWRTRFGLRLRFCGEDPYAAESLGIKVRLYKYVGVLMSGALAGFGGAFLAVVAANIYREGQTGGRGFVGLAALIFGNWKPGGMAMGATLFGYVDSLQLRSDAGARALILFVAFLLLAAAVYLLWKRRKISWMVTIVLSIAMFWWFMTTTSMPPQVTFVAPYVTTLVVLSVAGTRFRPPKADGVVYRKGEGD